MGMPMGGQVRRGESGRRMPLVLIGDEVGVVHRGTALVYGFGASLLGGLIWGYAAVIGGDLFVWGGVPLAIGIGLFIGGAMHAGAGRASPDLVAIAGALTPFAIFFGLVLFFPAIILARGGLLIALLSGALCACAAALALGRDLWRERRRWPKGPQAIPREPRVYTSPPQRRAATGSLPEVENLSRPGMASVRVRTRTSPVHVFIATYETETHLAAVTMDGRAYKGGRVRPGRDVVTARVADNPPRFVGFRFRGIRATIEIWADRVPVSTVYDGDPRGSGDAGSVARDRPAPRDSP